MFRFFIYQGEANLPALIWAPSSAEASNILQEYLWKKWGERVCIWPAEMREASFQEEGALPVITI